jgi:hypothetical protein
MFWVVVEDADSIDEQVKNLLDKSGIEYVCLNIHERNYGNAQKNLGLTYIRDNRLKGIVYIADDDNLYDARLFDEIRKTKRVSVFPVGHLGPHGIEGPIVKGGKIVGWDADWLSRKFPVDMGGFAFNAELLCNLGDPLWTYTKRGGETEFLERIATSSEELEVLCDDCKRCFVFHNHPLGQSIIYALTIRRIRVALGKTKRFLVSLFKKPRQKG